MFLVIRYAWTILPTSELALQEAMFAGLPCIVFSHGGAAQLISDGETGFVVDSAADYRDGIRPATSSTAGAEQMRGNPGRPTCPRPVGHRKSCSLR